MAAANARRGRSAGADRLGQPRVSRQVRRDTLLDAAVALLERGDHPEVSMDAVAEVAGVSRPLVYKHFSNSGELLAAVYRREAAALHEDLAVEVAAAETLNEMYRVLIRGSLRAATERGHVFTALRAAGGRTRELRGEQHARDRETVRAFSARAVRERGLDRALATTISTVLLGSIDAVLARWRRHPTEDEAHLLEDIYMRMVTAAYDSADGRADVGLPVRGRTSRRGGGKPNPS